MATLLSSLETQTRRHLQEVSASFWSSAELVDIMNKGIKDLWRSVIDLHQEHYLTIDITNLAVTASTEALAGVPADCFRVHLIEPKLTSTSGSYRGLIFVPRDYNSPDFIAARTLGDVDGTQNQTIFYTLISAGPPTGAPSIIIAPTLSSAIAAGNLRLAYVPTVAEKAANENNPIPGESDQALIAWTVAYALAKDREDRTPDPNWIAIYGTEKQNILVSLTPRQTQEPDVVEPMFGGLW
jgi:hypothetical protein